MIIFLFQILSKFNEILFAASGSKTTLYNIQDLGDPNSLADEETEEPLETQFLIKWKNWANIHNTWESEETLKAQKANGFKKVEVYQKKEAEIAQWLVQCCNW